jgi:2Fe-2S ferredoxin
VPKIVFIENDTTERAVEVKAGLSLMEGAVKHGVAGIEAECGGACSCATCHVYVDEAWSAVTGTPADMEQSLLDFAVNVQPNSRLACQIKVTDALDGLVVRVAMGEDV